MSTAEIKQKLHNYLEIADDRKLNAIYIMVEEEIKYSAVEYSEEFLKELDDRYNELLKDPSKAISAEQMNVRIQKIMKSHKK